MSINTQVSTLYDRDPFSYVSALQQIEEYSRWLSLDVLGSASDYQKLADDFKRGAFPETEPDSKSKAPSKYYLTEIRSSDGRVVFKEDCFLQVELSKENGLFFFQNDKFNIFGSGFTKEDALKDFSEFFVHDYLSYKRTPPENLTQDALQLLNEYESVINIFDPA